METTAESVIARHNMNTCQSFIDLATDEGVASYTAMKTALLKPARPHSVHPTKRILAFKFFVR